MSHEIVHLDHLLKRRGLTLHQLSTVTKISYPSLLALKKNRTRGGKPIKLLDIATVIKLCHALDCPIQKLIVIPEKSKGKRQLTQVVPEMPSIAYKQADLVDVVDQVETEVSTPTPARVPDQKPTRVERHVTNNGTFIKCRHCGKLMLLTDRRVWETMVNHLRDRHDVITVDPELQRKLDILDSED